MVKDKAKKNPVLTSPWKIGMMVALLLAVVGFGTVYFMVRVYDIELAWLEGSLLRWEVDSFAFFEEMYPLAAGVLLLSIISYFLVASAVRRYRCYLNSGQDYRRLVQLADSIDDLTNPAQIARLKNYPELQSVLRSYGDQIRDISSQLNEQQAEENQRSVDLEMEIDTLLQGEATPDSLIEDHWWTPLYRKVEAHVQETKSAMAELKKRVHDGKTALGRVALSTGRIVEQIGGTAEAFPEIAQAVGELSKIAEALQHDGKEGAGASAGCDNSHLKPVVKEMENTLHKLEDGGKVLNEFSEENNGLALNIALMAAKGEASEHDLAQFAEKVRSTADRFNRLSTTFTSMAQGLLGTCYSLKEKLDIEPSEVHGAEGNDEIKRSIAGIVKRLEERFAQLQERISYVGNEINDTQELVNKSIKSIAGEEQVEDGEPSAESLSGESDEEEMILERSGDSGETDTGDELVIDHGRLWSEERNTQPGQPSMERAQADGFPLDGDNEAPLDEAVDEETPGEAPEAPAQTEESEIAEEAEMEDTPSMETMEDAKQEYVIPSMDEAPDEADSTAESMMSPEEEAEGQSAGAGEIPEDAEQHKWFKIDIDKEEQTSGVASEEVEVRESADIAAEETEEDEIPDISFGEAAVDNAAAEPFEGTEPETPSDISIDGLETDIPVSEPADTQASPVVDGQEQEHPKELSADEEDPIYDLFELGAVEYVEETMTKS